MPRQKQATLFLREQIKAKIKNEKRKDEERKHKQFFIKKNTQKEAKRVNNVGNKTLFYLIQ